jgi:hypothetical protein
MSPPDAMSDPEDAGLLFRFLEDLEQKGCSVSTLRNYRRDLELFLRDFLGKELETGTVGPETVRQAGRKEILFFLRHREGTDSKNTLRRRATALCSFYRWLCAEGLLKESPFEDEEGNTRLLRAALEKRPGPPRLEDLSEEFFGPETWLESAFERTLKKALDLDEGTSVLLLEMPEAIRQALPPFVERTERWRENSNFSHEPAVLRLAPEGHPAEVSVRHVPDAGAFQLQFRQKTLTQIATRGPGEEFETRPVLETLAFLWQKEWVLPDPLVEQLQRMSNRSLSQSDQTLRGRPNCPAKIYEDASSPKTHRQVGLEVGTVLAGAFRMAPGETVEIAVEGGDVDLTTLIP